MQSERGIGLIASIVILAIVGLGGYAAIKATQSSRIGVDTSGEEQKEDSVLASVKTDIANTLTDVQANIRANADVAVESAIGTLSELSVRIQNSLSRADAGAHAELEAMKSQVDGISAELSSDVSGAEVSIESMLQGLRAYVRGGAGVEAGAEAGSGDESSDGNGVEVEVGVSGEVSL